MKHMSKEEFKINQQDRGLQVYTLEGPLYFGATELIMKTISSDGSPEIAIDQEEVTVVDASGALLLLQLKNQLKERRQNLYLGGNDLDLGGILRKMNVFQSFGATGHFENIEALMKFLRELNKVEKNAATLNM